MWVAIAAVAAVLSAVQLIPQAWNAIRSRDLSAVSLPSFALISFTTLLWALYGWHLRDVAIVASNGVACLCALTVTVMKVTKG